MEQPSARPWPGVGLDATGGGDSVERRLDRLLAEAARAHAHFDRFLSSQPDPAMTNQNLQRAGSIPLLDAAAAISADVRNSLLRPPLTPMVDNTNPPVPPQTCATSKLTISDGGARNTASRADTSTAPQEIKRSSREGRLVARLNRDLAEARATARELESTNDELRASLSKARTQVENTSALRLALDASRAKEHGLTETVSKQAQELETLRREKRDAEAELERLRTLLAAHSWFEHQM